LKTEAPLVTLLRYNLEKEGFSVCEAGDGEEALVQIAERKPDLVLLDWMLPLVSGIEVCRRIRRSRETRSLPVIILTARAGRPTGCAVSTAAPTTMSSSRSARANSSPVCVR
jgi:two-component system phosphate regulon response regulator PhoB